MKKRPNINCTHYTSNGSCTHPGKDKIYYFFYPFCILENNPDSKSCMVQDKYERPNAPPAPPRRKNEN